MSEKRPIDIISPEEFDQVIRACSRRAPSGLRDRALLALLYGAGCRLQEALDLRAVDVDPDAGTVRIHRGKGNKARTAGIDTGNAALVAEWMAYRKGTLKLNGRKPLLCQIQEGKVGEPLSQAHVRGMLARRGKKAGIERRFHAHGLRHSHAARLASGNIPLHVIQKQLGHSSLATTSRYLDHVQPADVVAAVRSLVED